MLRPDLLTPLPAQCTLSSVLVDTSQGIDHRLYQYLTFEHGILRIFFPITLSVALAHRTDLFHSFALDPYHISRFPSSSCSFLGMYIYCLSHPPHSNDLKYALWPET
jgi:hypothetical protein